MGTWDIGFFDNDMACDWENGIKENKNLDYIKNALLPVLNNSEETLDIDEANKALAASESLGRLAGEIGESSSYTKHLDLWIQEFNDIIPKELIAEAIVALDKIISVDSELRQFWTLRGDLDNWKDSILNLKNRLTNYL